MQQNTNDLAGRIGDQASTAAGQAKELARVGTQQVKEITQTTRERALREIDSRRKSFAGEVEKLAGTLESQSGGSQAGPVLDLAASAARKLSTALKDNTAEQLLQSAARSPVAILAGTFALGFFVTRLFKA